MEWERREAADPPVQNLERLSKGPTPGIVGAEFRSRVGQAPVGPDRLSGPEGAGFRGRLVAEGDHHIDPGCIRRIKSIPALCVEPIGRNVILLEDFKGERMHGGSRMAAGAQGLDG
jgi:hypothetical protein